MNLGQVRWCSEVVCAWRALGLVARVGLVVAVLGGGIGVGSRFGRSDPGLLLLRGDGRLGHRCLVLGGHGDGGSHNSVSRMETKVLTVSRGTRSLIVRGGGKANVEYRND